MDTKFGDKKLEDIHTSEEFADFIFDQLVRSGIPTSELREIVEGVGKMLDADDLEQQRKGAGA